MNINALIFISDRIKIGYRVIGNIFARRKNLKISGFNITS
jgi:hypothetical protein